MSQTLIRFVDSFLKERLNAQEFSAAYMELWRIERDGGFGVRDAEQASQFLSTVFCLVDLFNPSPDRTDYELDEAGLREQICSEKKNLGLG